jgi:hypothetical protein
MAKSLAALSLATRFLSHPPQTLAHSRIDLVQVEVVMVDEDGQARGRCGRISHTATSRTGFVIR